jgi:hypothetical protein
MQRPWLTVRAGADGRFSMEGLAAGQLMLSASHPRGRGEAPEVTLAPGQTTEVTVTVGRETSVAGVVRFEDGTPAAGISVAAAWAFSGGYGIRDARTAADGAYRIAGVNPGEVTVVATRGRVQGMAIASGLPHQARVKVGADEAKTGVDLVLPRAGLRIRGTVIGADGVAKDGVSLTVRPEPRRNGWIYAVDAKRDQVLTGADGTFVFEDLDPGPYEITARHPDCPTVKVSAVAAGASNVRIVLLPEATIAGKGLDADGKPLRSFAVRVIAGKPAAVPAGEAALPRSASVSVQAPDGAFEVRGLGPGLHDVVLTTSDGRSGRLPGLVLAPGESKRDVIVRVDEGASVKLRVAEHDTGAPIAGADVRISLEDQALASGKTDARGDVQLTGLPPGVTARLLITAPGLTFKYVADFQDIALLGSKATTDLGTIDLLGERDVERHRAGGLLGLKLAGGVGHVVVESVIAGAPASRAGIRPGELVVSVDGRDTRRLSPRSLGYLLAGDPGTTVSVQLAGPQGPHALTLTRAAPPDRP